MYTSVCPLQFLSVYVLVEKSTSSPLCNGLEVDQSLMQGIPVDFFKCIYIFADPRHTGLQVFRMRNLQMHMYRQSQNIHLHLEVRLGEALLEKSQTFVASCTSVVPAVTEPCGTSVATCTWLSGMYRA